VGAHTYKATRLQQAGILNYKVAVMDCMLFKALGDKFF
jgi:hypothetical protein